MADVVSGRVVNPTVRGKVVPPASPLGAIFSEASDFVRSVGSGATSGFLDEIMSGAKSNVEFLANREPGQSVAGRFQEGLFRNPLEDDVAQAEMARQAGKTEAISPGTRLAGEVTGAILTAPLVAGATGVNLAAKGLSRGKRALDALKIGGLSGGLAGAGFADGGLSERAEGAARGAALGAGLGAASVPVVAAGGAVARSAGRALGLGQSGPRGRAARAVSRAFDADEITPARSAARGRTLGPQSTLVDTGGANVRGLGAGVANVPGRAKNQAERVLNRRVLNQDQRLRVVLGATLADAPFEETVEAAIKTRAAAAKPLYERAFTVNGAARQPLKGGALRSLIEKSKDIQSAIRTAKRLPQFVDLEDTDIRVLDQAYKEIGGKAQAARRAGNSVTNRNLQELRLTFRDAIVKKVPVYGKALDAFSSDSTLIDAMELGRDVLKADAAITSKIIGKMPKGEQEMFAIGAARAIQDKMAAVADTADVTRRIFGNKAIRDKIRAAFPSEPAFRQFQMEVMRQAKFARVRNEVVTSVGSRTTPLAANIQSLGVLPQSAANLGEDAVRGGARGASIGVLGRVVEKLRAPGAGTKEEIGRLLFSEGPAELEAALRTVGRAQAPRGVPGRAANVIGVQSGRTAGEQR